MPEVRRLTVRGRYDSIPTIIQFVGDSARAAGLSDKEAFHCQMSVDEACTNVIEHAYGQEDIGDIDVVCHVVIGSCTIEIRDQGTPFDPDSVPVPQLGGSIEEIKPGGIGLHLMRRLMDDVRFEFGEHGNYLIMRKAHSPDEPAGTLKPRLPVREEEDGIWVIKPEGRIDAVATPELEATLIGLLTERHIWLVLDMKDVTYISSRGLKECVTAWRRAHDLGGNVAVSSLNSNVLSIFETIGFTQVFDIFPDAADAVAVLRRQRRIAEKK